MTGSHIDSTADSNGPVAGANSAATGSSDPDSAATGTAGGDSKGEPAESHIESEAASQFRTDGGADPETGNMDPDADSSVQEAGDSYVELTGGTYIESTIIMTTVRIVAPFVMTFGLFITLHGADSPGGGFQGGVVLASVLVMIAIAYGTAPTRDWINAPAIGGLIGGGVLLFALIGLGTLTLGGNFLEYTLYGGTTASKYGIELVELGIGATVVGVVTSIFFVLSRGFEVESGGEVE
jgi:multicomponent Na+:H+ antiporter subunit B